MDMGQSLGRILIVLGISITVIGAILYYGGKIGIGRLPGDIFFKKGNFSFYFPIVTCILLSILLTILFNLFRFKK